MSTLPLNERWGMLPWEPGQSKTYQEEQSIERVWQGLAFLCNPAACAEPCLFLRCSQTLLNIFVVAFKGPKPLWFLWKTNPPFRLKYYCSWVWYWLVEISSSEEIWINPKQEWNTYYVHFTKDMTSRVGVFWMNKMQV